MDVGTVESGASVSVEKEGSAPLQGCGEGRMEGRLTLLSGWRITDAQSGVTVCPVRC